MYLGSTYLPCTALRKRWAMGRSRTRRLMIEGVGGQAWDDPGRHVTQARLVGPHDSRGETLARRSGAVAAAGLRVSESGKKSYCVCVCFFAKKLLCEEVRTWKFQILHTSHFNLVRPAQKASTRQSGAWTPNDT
jgi:hypothetical protein